MTRKIINEDSKKRMHLSQEEVDDLCFRIREAFKENGGGGIEIETETGISVFHALTEKVRIWYQDYGSNWNNVPENHWFRTLFNYSKEKKRKKWIQGYINIMEAYCEAFGFPKPKSSSSMPKETIPSKVSTPSTSIDFILPYKELNASFWNQIKTENIKYNKFLLNLHSEEKTICSAILNGIVSSIDITIESDEYGEEFNNFDPNLDKIEVLTTEIKNSLHLNKNKLVVITSASGAGKTTLLYSIANALYENICTIKITKPVKEKLSFISQQGVVLIDEISTHIDQLMHYNEYLQIAFPKGFVLIIADQEVVYNAYIDKNKKFLRSFGNDYFRIGINPHEDNLYNIYKTVEEIVTISNNLNLLSDLRKGKSSFVSLLKSDRRDPRTIADRLVDLYIETGLKSPAFRTWLNPDWDTLLQLSESENILKLYSIVAFTSQYSAEFSISLIDNNNFEWNDIYLKISRNDESYPLQFRNGIVSIRHNRLAKWFFIDRPTNKEFAIRFFQSFFLDCNYTPTKIALLRKLYRNSHGKILDQLNWTETDYYNKLIEYHKNNIENDKDKQASKSYYESLKIKYIFDRKEYFKLVEKRLDIKNNDEKKYLYSSVIKTLIHHEKDEGNLELALKMIEECRTENWFDEWIGKLESVAKWKVLTTQLLKVSDLNLKTYCIEQGFTYSMIEDFTIRLIHKKTFRHDRKILPLIEYVLELCRNNPLYNSSNYIEILKAYIAFLMLNRQYEIVIKELSYENKIDNHSLLSHLGYALFSLHKDIQEKYSHLGKGEELILTSFKTSPTNVHTITYLSKILKFNRTGFSKSILIALQKELCVALLSFKSLSLVNCLITVCEKIGDFSMAESTLRHTTNEDPEKTFIKKINLAHLLLYKYKIDASASLKQEIEELLTWCKQYNNNHSSVQLLQLIYYNVIRDDKMKFSNNNIEALKLSRILLLKRGYSSYAHSAIIKSLYFANEHENCLKEIVSNYYNKDYYEDYEINNLFYASILKLCEGDEDKFVDYFTLYSIHIKKLFKDKNFETNDYFKYIYYTIKKDFANEEMKAAKDAIKNDSVSNFNLTFLNRLITFLLSIKNYNAIHSLINFIRKIKKIILPDDIILHYRACGILCHNRLFIDKPLWEGKADNIIIFPNQYNEQMLNLLYKYIEIFKDLGFIRRKIVFLYCVLKNLQKNLNAELVSNLSELMERDKKLLFDEQMTYRNRVNLKGSIEKINSQELVIKDEFNNSHYFNSSTLIKKLEIGQKAKNWSYFSIRNEKVKEGFGPRILISNVEPGFVIDGYHDSERVSNTNTLRTPQGINFDQWLMNKKLI